MKLLLIGGTSGIGKKLEPILSHDYDISSVGSKQLDILVPEQIEEALEIEQPDVVVNLAGKNINSFLHKATNENIADSLNVNVLGTLYLMRATISYMRPKQFGRIIMTSSVLSESTIVGTSMYSASKSFIETLVRVGAAENANKGITINALRLGYMDAGLTYTIPEEMRNKIKATIPMNKFGNIKNIADAIEFIVKADYVTGTSIDINGGLI